jgi:hypothetical protein
MRLLKIILYRFLKNIRPPLGVNYYEFIWSYGYHLLGVLPLPFYILRLL